MGKPERVREVLWGPLTPEYLQQKMDAGWKPVAVEWEREAAAGPPDSGEMKEDVPFGLKVSNDCLHLEENPAEREILTLAIELIVQDSPMSRVAEELNHRGFRTRYGSPWTAAAVFNLLPRMIEVGPKIFTSQEWAARRRQLFRVV